MIDERPVSPEHSLRAWHGLALLHQFGKLWSVGPLVRRVLSQATCGILIAGWMGSACSKSTWADSMGTPTTGTLVVSVGGLTGSPANGGSAVAQRTDAAGTPITINVSAAGSGSNTSVPAGTYSVTYTPPSGWSVATSNPVTGTVTAVAKRCIPITGTA